MQNWSDQQNSTLIKEVEELKRSLEAAEMDDRMRKESEISQLKEALEQIMMQKRFKVIAEDTSCRFCIGDVIICDQYFDKKR